MTIVADMITCDARVGLSTCAIESVDIDSLIGKTTESRFIGGSDTVDMPIVDAIIRQTGEILAVHGQTFAIVRCTVK